MPGPNVRRLVFLLFLLSGACGLVYQVVWTRMMTLVFGITVYAVTTVLCSFMAGLALGSLYFGRRADRTRRPLAAYGALEIAIGVCGLLLPLALEAVRPLFVGIHRALYEDNYALFSLARFCIVFPMLLLPTFLMGGTFPLVSRYFVRGQGSFARDVGFLYAVNTTGAVLGTFAVGFVLLSQIGMWGSILVAAGLNVAVGVVSLAIGRAGEVDLDAPESAAPAPSSEGEAPREAPAAPSEFDVSLSRGGVLLVMAAIGLSGFVSLGLEVLWTRVLVFHTHNSTYAFSAMLMAFLIGIAGGGWLLGAIAPRIRRPLLFFAGLEVGIAVWSVFSMWWVGRLPTFTRALAKALPLNDWIEIVLLILGQTLAVLLVPATLMGMTFPLATRLVSRSMKNVGRNVGDVYAVNTVGTVLGSFSVGFVLIPLLGVRTSFVALAGVNCAIAAALLLASTDLSATVRRGGALACLLFVVAAQLVMPEDVIRNDFSKALGEIRYYKEEVTDTIMVIDLFDPVSGFPLEDNRMLVFADGRGTAGHVTQGEDRFYAHLPMLLHPAPKDVLLICIGAGNTLGAFLTHDRMERIDAVELSAGVLEASRLFKTNQGALDPPLDPRVEIRVEDGRNWLLGTERTYDVIHLDPPELHSAGVVYLYTEEFYELAKARLNPGGVFSHWFNATKMTLEEMRSVVATFKKVFPHGTVWQGPGIYSWNLIATDAPLRVPMADAARIVASEEDVRASLYGAESRLAEPGFLFSWLLMNETTLEEFSKGAAIATDDRTRIDFSSPRSPYSGFGFVHIFAATKAEWILESEKEKRGDGASEPEPGGWLEVSRIALETDDVREIVDWQGMPEAERAEIEAQIVRGLDHRRDIVERFFLKLKPELDNIRLGTVEE